MKKNVLGLYFCQSLWGISILTIIPCMFLLWVLPIQHGGFHLILYGIFLVLDFYILLHKRTSTMKWIFLISTLCIMTNYMSFAESLVDGLLFAVAFIFGLIFCYIFFMQNISISTAVMVGILGFALACGTYAWVGWFTISLAIVGSYLSKKRWHKIQKREELWVLMHLVLICMSITYASMNSISLISI